MEKQNVIEILSDPGLVPVIRLDSGEKLPKLLDALLAGGIRAAELTMTIPGAVTLLAENRKRFGDSLLLGMGTVTDRETARAAIEAGAHFLVSSFPVPEVIAEANAAGVVMVAGAFSPYEVFSADQAGADFVKVFPLNLAGVGYLKDLKGPLPHVKFFPTGGITLENIPEVLKYACGCGVGGALVRQDLIKAENWQGITELALEYVTTARNARGK